MPSRASIKRPIVSLLAQGAAMVMDVEGGDTSATTNANPSNSATLGGKAGAAAAKVLKGNESLPAVQINHMEIRASETNWRPKGTKSCWKYTLT